MNDLPINFDVIALVRLRAEVGANASVNCDPAGCDQLITFSTRANASCGEIAIQTHKKVEALSCLEVARIAQRLYLSTTQLLLRVWLCFRQTDYFAAVFPLAALVEQLDPFEPLQNVAFRDDRARSSKTSML